MKKQYSKPDFKYVELDILDIIAVSDLEHIDIGPIGEDEIEAIRPGRPGGGLVLMGGFGKDSF